ncbi:hypothetical protein [Weissella cibaria]|uniref:hypothetical protein n=1 Tax=Weissella cibaria TaxID=137591 RepID=UPI000705E064|nr:hypothetical protein [Weissella cibaria]ALI32837.1 hypothetical protein AO080_04940 [Weissella cibaria]MBD1501102.1 hypothetical protein [Weissella cibaria]MCG4286412.1 hypothetical protein [Weissella cibaria]HCN26875.1 hypothetical protein [Weissella cibaria]HCU09462.1 hypothetical protein [Weissella cibaria]
MKRLIVVALIVFGLSLVGGTAFGDETAVSRVTTSQTTTNGAKATSAQLDGGAVVQYQTHDEVQAMKAGNQTNHTLAGYTRLGLVVVAVTTIGGLVWQSLRREIRRAG